MRHKLTLFALLAGLIFWLPVHAVILDEEPSKSPERLIEVKNEGMKKNLQIPEREQQPADNLPEDAAPDEQQTVKIDMVQLPTGIQIGKYEVTQGQWKAVLGNKNNPSKFDSCGDNCPVEQVSWDRVHIFIRALNTQTGKHYRLPTEDERNLACQAGSSTAYCGSNSIDAVAWYEGNSGGITHAVGQKQPNTWGLYDMSGNVWEWTSSCWEGNCSYRVVRGGSWFDTPAFARSADVYKLKTSFFSGHLGFRLVLDR